MDWRCEWCGKPHEENDPPCDNCGHGTFERAVVPVAEGESGLGSKATAWVCTECGREHPKHTPPCSRCGHEELERQRQTVDDDELEVPGYLDLITPGHLAVGAVVGIVLVVLTLGATGIVDLPGFGTSVPEVTNVPGNATTAGNVSLADAESAYIDAINEERQAQNAGTLSRSGELDELATYLNQKLLKSVFVDGNQPSRERITNLFEDRCGELVEPYSTSVDAASAGSAAELGQQLAAKHRSEVGVEDGQRTGLDLHMGPDGRVYLLQITC